MTRGARCAAKSGSVTTSPAFSAGSHSGATSSPVASTDSSALIVCRSPRSSMRALSRVSRLPSAVRTPRFATMPMSAVKGATPVPGTTVALRTSR